jgi:hypothetical protein
MSWTIYDYVHPSDGNLMRDWSSRLQGKERVKLDFKIDALQQHGTQLIPNIVAPTGVPSIFKLRVQGQVKLRPMLCAGPRDEVSFTFLLGAKEVQFKYEPAGAPNIAASYRNDLIANPHRRERHERANRKAKE